MPARCRRKGSNRGRSHAPRVRHPRCQEDSPRSRMGLHASTLRPGSPCATSQRVHNMSAVIFAGPSFPPSARPTIAGLEWRPPLCRGDLYLAALQRPRLIGVVDGYFEIVPTVWHKEILWALAQGIHVYGAASIGALAGHRARGFRHDWRRSVYRQFRSGGLTDDDEVAILHGPAEVDYVPVTEAMVNVRSHD